MVMNGITLRSSNIAMGNPHGGLNEHYRIGWWVFQPCSVSPGYDVKFRFYLNHVKSKLKCYTVTLPLSVGTVRWSAAGAVLHFSSLTTHFAWGERAFLCLRFLEMTCVWHLCRKPMLFTEFFWASFKLPFLQKGMGADLGNSDGVWQYPLVMTNIAMV